MGATASISDSQVTLVDWLSDTGKIIDYNDEGNINTMDNLYRTERISPDGVPNELHYTAECAAEGLDITVRCGRRAISTFLT